MADQRIKDADKSLMKKLSHSESWLGSKMGKWLRKFVLFCPDWIRISPGPACQGKSWSNLCGLRNVISLWVVVSLLVTTVCTQTVSAATKAEKEAKQIEKIKQKVARLGTGENARVSVGLKKQDKELKGYVSNIDEDSFVVTNLKTKETTTVAYRDVAYIRGKGLPTAAKAGIAVGAIVGALLLIMYAACGSGGCG